MKELNDRATTLLPARPGSSIVEFVDRTPLWAILLLGLAVYGLVVLASTAAQLALIRFGCTVTKNGAGEVQTLGDLFYFNIVTILTIGYGDLSPVGWGRPIASLEALTGVGIFGVLVSAAVIKLMLPRANAIVFSKYCYFSLSERRFVVIFINTTRSRLINVDLCSVLKVGYSNGNWHVRPPYRAPYIGESAWIFGVNTLSELAGPNEVGLFDFSSLTIYPEDGLKFGLSGSLGFANYSTSVRYTLDECWVVRSLAELPEAALRQPAWGTPGFESAFNYVPDRRMTFLDLARLNGAQLVGKFAGLAGACQPAD